MSYPFVHSATDLGLAKGPRLAVVWHMAEGGGTVAFLAKPNPRGVSVHFVIEYSGRIVQMLDVTHMHSSLRTSDIRTTDDADGFYGVTAARAVMGDWADITHGTQGPNHASIGVEMEGFAATGPNTAQTLAMATLWHDLSTRWPFIRSLGHRDFQDYKACPGRQIPWSVVGGHGPLEAPMYIYEKPTTAVVKKGAKLYTSESLKNVAETLTAQVSMPAVGRYDMPMRCVNRGGIARWVHLEDCVSITQDPAPAPADCSAWETWYALAPKG